MDYIYDNLILPLAIRYFAISKCPFLEAIANEPT